MSRISRKIKNILYDRVTPSWLFGLYWNWKNRKDTQTFFTRLASGEDLMNFVTDAERTHWIPRIEHVLASADNQKIPRHPQAGSIQNHLLCMHNGIMIDPLSYYSYPMLKMLMLNGGVHEPQEEYVFQQVLVDLRKRENEAGRFRMMELGSYFSFYSLWFKDTFPDAACYMIEPHRSNLEYGKHNFRLNNADGYFYHYGISDKVDKSKNLTTVDTLCQELSIDHLDILHSDIQGYELDMLHGAVHMLTAQKVSYIFISTHSNELHRDCRRYLEDLAYEVVASADLDESYSWDGVLVMKSARNTDTSTIEISKRKI